MRFTSRDPAKGEYKEPLTLHKYLYVHNNPVNGIDPTGLFSLVSISITSVIIGVLSGLLTYAVTGSVKTSLIVGVLAAALTAIVMTIGVSGLIKVIKSGVHLLRSKLIGRHSISAGYAIFGFTLGFFLGFKYPNLRVVRDNVYAIATLYIANILDQGFYRQRFGLLFGPAAVAFIEWCHYYVGAIAFRSLYFATGFLAGFSVGITARRTYDIFAPREEQDALDF